MRILVYPHDLNMGGSQTNAIELAAAVSRLGHDCVVFGRPGSLCARIDDLGLEFVESPDPGRRPSLRTVKVLREVTRTREIDIIHGYEWPPGMEAVLAAEGLPGTAAVCTVMSMAVAPFLPRSLPLVVGTQQISAVEQASGRLNVNLIEPPVDLEHNGHVTSLVVDQFKNDWRLDERPVVVCVSRLVPELKAEGILTAIEVAGALASVVPFQLVVVGDGRARAAMEAAAERTNQLAGRKTVVFTGELADPRPAYAAADVVLGMGGSALRSLAFSKPLVVQGENGFFRRLSPDSVDEFRWQGWYGVGPGAKYGPKTLQTELVPLLTDLSMRSDLAIFGREVVEDISLARAAKLQVTIYRDAFASRVKQKRRYVDGGRSAAQLGRYYAVQRLDRLRGRRRADDFNADPVAGTRTTSRTAPVTAKEDGPILYFPGVGWDTLAGTDRHLATELSRHSPVVWVDTPHSVLRKRDRVVPGLSHPLDNVVRLRAPTFAGVQRPFLRGVANRRRVRAARHYLNANGLSPTAVIASTTAPMLDLLDDISGIRVYYATDDYVEAADLWNVNKRYLSRSRERNLASADLVMAVTPELARHLQRGPQAPRWLANGADLDRFVGMANVPSADIPLTSPVAGIVGQFNSRTDLRLLQYVQQTGMSLLLVGPRWFIHAEDERLFDELTNAPGVHWVDELSRAELAPFLRRLDVGLTPYADSMFNRRSYPLKTLEYLAAGVPVVTTDVASLAGLDRRYVSAERTAAEFSKQVWKVAREPMNHNDIQTSVQSDSWASRAAQLLAWLNTEAQG